MPQRKCINTVPKTISPKVNLIARLEVELAIFETAVGQFNRFTTRTASKDYHPK